MSSRRRGNQQNRGSGARIIGWAFVLSVVFSAGLIVGLQLDGDPESWLVSSNTESTKDKDSQSTDDSEDKGPIFSFYEKLSGGEPPEAATATKENSEPNTASEDEETNGAHAGERNETGSEQSALYTVQVSAFPDLSKAEMRLEELVAHGLNPHVVAAPADNGNTFYRLRIGRFSTIDAAESARKRLADQLDSEPVVTDF